ncbi:MAG: helix-turn-helix domain-containing protein [Roseburia sp.]|nr:helix-turn-helix domain-containing protein [Roseburia sp.]MCM1098154.1 helix-turn-helix domain-containing protein [Ruminococcus flavefaciens]
MKTEHLENCLKDLILSADTPIPACKAEEGIHFLCPPPNIPIPGAVFAGTLSEWKTVCSLQRVYPKCTYLICTYGETALPEKPEGCTCNLFVLNASVKTVLYKLTSLLAGQTPRADDRYRLYVDFWRAIMAGSFEKKEQVAAYLKSFPYKTHPHLACIVVVPETPDLNPLQTHEIQQALQSFFPETNLFYYEGEWIILYSQEKDTSVTLEISYDAFSGLLEQYRLNAGISYVCQLPEQFRILYLTASTSIKIGQSMKLSPYIRRIYTYYQYNPYYVIHLSAQKFTEIHNTKNLIYLAHPDAIRLYYYDIDHKNNLLDVLFAYLSCAQNLSLTSQMLYMHRNTVLNKLNKIEEFLHHKPFSEKDHFLMLLSCMIVKYQESQNKITEFFPDDAAGKEKSK